MTELCTKCTELRVSYRAAVMEFHRLKNKFELARMSHQIEVARALEERVRLLEGECEEIRVTLFAHKQHFHSL